MSSPVLTITVMSSGGITAASPSSNFEAPIPPARAVTFMDACTGAPSVAALLGILWNAADRGSATEGTPLQSHHAITRGLYLVTTIDADRKQCHSLENSRTFDRARVHWPQALDETYRVHNSRLRFFRIAGDE